MLRKIVKFENFDGEMVEKALYFNLSQAEIIEMETMGPVSLSSLLRNISYEKNKSKIVEFVRTIVLKAYGERTEDGDFVKTQLMRDKFASSEAYSVLFMDILKDAESLAGFINSIVPKSALKEAENIQKYHPETMEKIDSYIKTGDFKSFDSSSKGDNNAVENKDTSK